MWRFSTDEWECEVAFNDDDVYFSGILRNNGTMANITIGEFKELITQAKEIIDGEN